MGRRRGLRGRDRFLPSSVRSADTVGVWRPAEASRVWGLALMDVLGVRV